MNEPCDALNEPRANVFELYLRLSKVNFDHDCQNFIYGTPAKTLKLQNRMRHYGSDFLCKICAKCFCTENHYRNVAPYSAVSKFSRKSRRLHTSFQGSPQHFKQVAATHIYIYIHLRIHIYIYKHMYVYVYICTYVYTVYEIYVYVYVYTHTFVHCRQNHTPNQSCYQG